MCKGYEQTVHRKGDISGSQTPEDTQPHSL